MPETQNNDDGLNTSDTSICYIILVVFYSDSSLNRTVCMFVCMHVCMYDSSVETLNNAVLALECNVIIHCSVVYNKHISVEDNVCLSKAV